MAACWFCQKVKGKRSCPARGGELICSRCCGSKRRVEIQCPDDCPYLYGAHDPKWESEARKREEARFLSHFFGLEDNRAAFLFFLHHLALSMNRFSALDDAELANVLETALKTLRTHSKGVVYLHRTDSFHLQELADWLAGVIGKRGEIPGAPDATDEEAIFVLQAFLAAVEEHRRRTPGERYLETAARLLGSHLAEAPPLELPDDLDESPPSELIVAP